MGSALFICITWIKRTDIMTCSRAVLAVFFLVMVFVTCSVTAASADQDSSLAHVVNSDRVQDDVVLMKLPKQVKPSKKIKHRHKSKKHKHWQHQYANTQESTISPTTTTGCIALSSGGWAIVNALQVEQSCDTICANACGGPASCNVDSQNSVDQFNFDFVISQVGASPCSSGEFSVDDVYAPNIFIGGAAGDCHYTSGSQSTCAATPPSGSNAVRLCCCRTSPCALA